MAYRGLFIGIDRYADDRVAWLSCANRDAVALHALFEDTLGPGGVLLGDDRATAAEIRRSLGELRETGKDDVVVIAFSGHGAPSHHLVAHDTDPDDLDRTAISLEELTSIFSSIPAKHLLFVLDCCFSGGMGAKVLMPETRSRDLRSAGELLDQLSGQGRVILAASAAHEPAWENARLRHGLLTYHVIEGLLGAPGVVEGDRIPLFRVLEYVTRSVVASASELGQEQHPAVRGSFEGEVVWPVFRKAEAYSFAFPGWDANRASADIRSLERLGFPTALVDAWAGSIPSLNELQLAAINEMHLLTGGNILVSAPTSSGKTMVGELAALKAALERRRSVFLLPMRALVNDKYDAFTRTYSAFGIRTIRATGEIADDVPDLMRGQYDICLMTNEKFAALALQVPHLLDQVSLVVVDEAQLIADEGRGVTLEFLLTMLKVRTHGRPPQLLLLSAVVGDAHGLDTWLGASLLRRTQRPIPLDEGVIRPDGAYRFMAPDGNEQVESPFISPLYDNRNRAWVIPLVRRLMDEGQQVIVFRATKSETRFAAEYLATSLGLPPATAAIEQMPAGDPSIASSALRKVLQGGVAFHNSDLDREERHALEERFRAPGSTLRVLVATTTLAMGVNTPASSVVIVDLQHPGTPPRPYSVAEYKNMVGRAGRLGFTERGRSFLIAPTAATEHVYWQRYVAGTPEDIESRFPLESGDPASVITRILATAEGRPDASGATSGGMTAADVIGFLTESFAASRRATISPGWVLDPAPFAHSLGQLTANGLVEADAEGRFHLTPLGRLAGQTGTDVRSVMRLVAALRAVPTDAINEPTLVAATQLTVELDDTYVPLNRRSKDKEPAAWLSLLRRRAVAGAVLGQLGYNAPDASTGVMRAKRAAACLMWMSDMPITQIERQLIQFGGAFDAAGPLRSVTARTLDLLPTTVAVAQILHPDLDLSDRAQDLFARLEVGLPEIAAPLARGVGEALTRGNYLELGRRGLLDLAVLGAASDEVLKECLDGSGAKVAAVRRFLANRELLPATLIVELPAYRQEDAATPS
jgi:Superfamily II helicase